MSSSKRARRRRRRKRKKERSWVYIEYSRVTPIIQWNNIQPVDLNFRNYAHRYLDPYLVRQSSGEKVNWQKEGF